VSSTKRLKTEPTASGDHFSFSFFLFFFLWANLSTFTNPLLQQILKSPLLNFVEVHEK
jgi:hypothetical protein